MIGIVFLLGLLAVQSAAPANDAAAARNEAYVEVRMGIDTTGRVDECEVVSTSAPQEFSERVCVIFRERARFTPKLDETGTPVRDSKTQRVQFKIED